MPNLYIEPDQRQLTVNTEDTLLTVATQQGIPIAHACGGHARCTTCRVYVLEGTDNLSERVGAEAALAEQMKFPPCVRLSCQTRLRGDARIRRATIEELDASIYKVQRAEVSAMGQLGEEKNVSALFADIVSYTPFAASMPAYDVVYILNQYFHMMGQVVKYHWGRIVDYYGDGFFAIFEQDDDSDTYVLNAVRAGQEMFRSLHSFNQSLMVNYQHQFSIRVGVHSGEAIVGMIGTEDMTKLTVIGDSVNMASRIEQANKELGTQFLIGQNTYAAVQEQVRVRGRYDVDLPGRAKVCTVYEVATDHND